MGDFFNALFFFFKTQQQIYCEPQQYPLEQLGVEKRSMAGAVLIVPPVVEIGDVSVVAKEGLLESSLSLCSWVSMEVQFKYTVNTYMFSEHQQHTNLQSFESGLFFFESCLLLPFIHFSKRHPCAGQRWHCIWQSTGPGGKTQINEIQCR